MGRPSAGGGGGCRTAGERGLGKELEGRPWNLILEHPHVLQERLNFLVGDGKPLNFNICYLTTQSEFFGYIFPVRDAWEWGKMCSSEASYEAAKTLQVKNDEKPKSGCSREDGK